MKNLITRVLPIITLLVLALGISLFSKANAQETSVSYCTRVTMAFQNEELGKLAVAVGICAEKREVCEEAKEVFSSVAKPENIVEKHDCSLQP